jgi:hypothetical protein
LFAVLFFSLFTIKCKKENIGTNIPRDSIIYAGVYDPNKMNKKVIEKIIKDSYINENYDFDFNQDGLTDLTFAISIFLAGMSDNCSLMFKSINTSILSDTVTVKSSNGDIVEKINFAQLLNEGSKISKDIYGILMGI